MEVKMADEVYCVVCGCSLADTYCDLSGLGFFANGSVICPECASNKLFDVGKIVGYSLMWRDFSLETHKFFADIEKAIEAFSAGVWFSIAYKNYNSRLRLCEELRNLEHSEIITRNVINDQNFNPNEERSKVNNGLRYDVMKRDGFHCQLCGATGKTAQLVIDHITPISRGGKTEMDNLQTLCFQCNSGKSDKVE